MIPANPYTTLPPDDPNKKVTICPTCNVWESYIGCSDSWIEEEQCHGCKKPVARCTCRR